MNEQVSPVLVRGRWQLSEFIFLEYRKGMGVVVDVGPFPQNPDDEQIEKAYGYLADADMDFLSLSDATWVLHLDRLSGHVPELKSDPLTGDISHPAAFEVTSIFASEVDRFFIKANRTESFDNGCYFLRILFNLQESAENPPVIFPMDDSEGAESSALAADPQEVAGVEAVSSSPSSVDEDEFYFYTKLTPEACFQKLKPYAPRVTDSTVIQMPMHPFDYTVTQANNSFTVRSVSTDNGHCYAYFAGVINAERDGGTTIVGDYGAEVTGFSKSVLPYGGILFSAALGLTAVRWMQTAATPPPQLQLWSLFAFAGLCLFGAIRLLSINDQMRWTLHEKEKSTLMNFVQTTLDAEPVEREVGS